MKNSQNKTRVVKVTKQTETKRGYYHSSMEAYRAIKKNLKEGFAPVEVKNILRKVEGAGMPCVYVKYVPLQYV